MSRDYAIVIPARDEERAIGRTLDALRGLDEEIGASGAILVIDDRSEDRTAEIAASKGARVLRAPEGTIGTLRNLGAEAASSSILCFLDADCEVAPSWRTALGAIVREKPIGLITGFPAAVPPDAGRLETILAFRRPSRAPSYIPSGNLIVTRDVFESVGGFDPRLATGEDHDFCARASARGIRIEPRPDFLAFHRGYPKTFGEYFRRERWHGRGDFQSWGCFLRSRPAVLGSLVLVSLAASAALAAAGALRPAGIVLALGAAIPILATAIARGDRSIARFPLFLARSALYLVARSLSGIDVLLSQGARGARRSA
ncbi:MAG: glycosyltransferase [Candidatus Eisenbacteria bacterium]|nr:glycosyltransferase [Candidatus Eisenbacteria bacterium]